MGQENRNFKPNMLPKFLEPFLPSYDISQMDLKNPNDKKLIIEAVLNRGTAKEIKWLFRNYTIKEIKSVLKNPRRGCWQERKLNYWTKVLNIKLPKFVYEVAIFSLEPRPKLLAKFFKFAKQTR